MKFQAKKVYGNWLYYPANKSAKVICDIAGRKTLSAKNISDLKQAGFGITTDFERPE